MLKITRKFNPSTSQIDFVSEGSSGDPAIDGALINLSRGGVRRYRLDDLQAHNGTGANWKDGASYHSVDCMKAYIARVSADIKAAIENGVANGAFSTDEVTLATVNGGVGGSLFEDDDDFEDEDEDEEYAA